MEKIEELKNELTTDELIEMVRDIIGYDGWFEDLDYWENDEDFFECMYQGRIMELVRALSYGNYNYMDDYVKINAYGNVESCSVFEYRKEVEDYAGDIIEHYLELYADNNVYPSDELKEKIHKYYEEKGQ